MRDATVDEIKQRVSMVETVQGYLPLKKAGTNWKGLCPFHSEKTPSFMVSDDRQMFHCFGCGEGGDVFSFLQKMEGYDFPEVLRLLADRAGVTLPKRDPRLTHERNMLAEILDLAARFFRKVLTDSTSAASAREYLNGRGLSPAAMQTFGLGYAPEGWETLAGFLAKRGYKEEDVIRAGLALRSMNGRGLYDRFRKRIMFPIRNAHGQVIGFTGRLLPEDEKKPEAGGKYVNTPEGPLYHKGEVLFGLDLAKQEVKRADLAVLVEGNMDVISSHQAGVTNVVAASGTALTDSQLRLLGRYTHRVAVAFDADAAGDAAARKGILAALRNGFLVKVIVIPAEAGKDPDDCIRKDPELWRTAIARSVDVFDYLLARVKATFDLRTVEGKKSSLEGIAPILAEVADPVAQAHYRKTVAEAIGIPEEVVRSSLPKPAAALLAAPEHRVPDTRRLSRGRMLSERLLALFLTLPAVRPVVQDTLRSEWLEGDDLRDLYALAVSAYARGVTPSGIPQTERTAELSAVLPLMLDAMPADAPEQETIELLTGLRGLRRRAEREALESDMREAERAGDAARVAELTRLFAEL